MSSYEDRIREARPKLSPSLRRLADFLLDSPIQAAFLTATELAHSLDIDPATVVRFAQKMDYPGYPQLQREIRDKVRLELLADRRSPADSPAAAAEAALADVVRHLELVRRTFSLDAATKLLAAFDEVERVILLADSAALPPARTLAGWLEAGGYTVHLAGGGPADLARALTGARKGDLVLAIQAVEETPFLPRALAEARGNRIATAALVAIPSLEITRHADILLAPHASADPSLGPVSLSAMVYALISMLVQARPGRFRAAAERIGTLTQRLLEPDSAAEPPPTRRRRS